MLVVVLYISKLFVSYIVQIKWKIIILLIKPSFSLYYKLQILTIVFMSTFSDYTVIWKIAFYIYLILKIDIRKCESDLFLSFGFKYFPDYKDEIKNMLFYS